MNKGKSKKKMNSYLKMVLIMLAGGVVGGIFGFVTSYSGENSIAVIGHGMNAFLLAVRDHTVLLECICGAICIMTVSYTHLTLPTNREVKISVYAAFSKKKK